MTLPLIVIFMLFSSSASEKMDRMQIMVVKHVDLSYVNRKYGDANVTVSRISRSDYAITAYFTIKDNIPDKLFLHIQVYALFSNTFRKMPIDVDKEICYGLPYLKKYSDDFTKYASIPDSCPLKAGSYYYKNYTFDASRMPYFPWQNIRTDLRF